MAENKLHALLSPSSSRRWMSCTPSALLERSIEERSSSAAEEGTVAHALAEITLKRELGYMSPAAYRAAEREILESEYADADMAEYVRDYVQYVLDEFEVVKRHTPDATIEIEASLPLVYYDTDDTGTGDVVIVADKVLRIIDLKYGRGVMVECEDNPQMKIYALGAMEKYAGLYDLETIEMTIYQPRLDNISTWSISLSDLLEWYITELRPKAELALAGEGEFVTGEHCRFCKIREQCRALADKNLEVLRYDFLEPSLLTDLEIADILAQSGKIQSWLKSIEDYTLTKALSGKRYDGFKLVEGRSVRKYADQDKVAQRLIDKGVPEAIIYERSMLGLTAMEEALGKKRFSELLTGLIVKPQGSPTLVPVSDKRPELNNLQQAINDFSDL